MFMIEDYSQDVMIALLPTTSDWCRQTLPHLTLCYLGSIEDLKPYVQNEALKTAMAIAFACPKLTLHVVGTDVFNEKSPVDVLLMEMSPELAAMRTFVERWDVSEHDFVPHCTVGPAGSVENYPFSITFDRILVSWGNDQTAYKLRCEEEVY